VSRAGARNKFVPGGEQLFQRIYTRLGCQGRPPHFVVEYHPYADLTHTIRLRDGVARVRLSDALGDAPRTVTEAAAAMLLGRLYRRQPPKQLIDIYTHFTHDPSTRRRLRSMRRSRGRRLAHSPAGAHHDLAPLFARLNRDYFASALGEPRLGWSKRFWRAQLGCFDPALNQILINRQLDHPRVPEYVVAYVLYHEMLHQKHPMRYIRCRRESHSARFRNEEKQFTDYARAKRFLAKFPRR
jgi:hypothetical protein